MDYQGKIKKVTGDEITLKLDREFDTDEVQRLTISGTPQVEINIVDQRNITSDQSGMIYGLFGDIADYTGYPTEFVKSWLKTAFAGFKGIEDFSLARDSMSQVLAGDFIEFILEFCLENGIPFKYQQYYLAADISRVLFLYLKYRMCFVCGKPHADIAHYETVGIGNNRHNIDHRKHRFMALCREHHTEQHKIGVDSFMNKYHLVPIKLNDETIVSLKIMTEQQIEEFNRKAESL